MTEPTLAEITRRVAASGGSRFSVPCPHCLVPIDAGCRNPDGSRYQFTHHRRMAAVSYVMALHTWAGADEMPVLERERMDRLARIVFRKLANVDRDLRDVAADTEART